MIICWAGLAATLSLALYYRNQSIHFEQKWHEAMAGIPVQQPSNREDTPKDWSREMRTSQQQVAPQSPLRTESREGAKGSPPPAVGAGIIRRDPENRARTRPRGEDWMTALQTNDPVRYEALQKRRQEAKVRAETAYAEATNYFMFRDTHNMTEADMEEYIRMLTLLEETRALTQQMQNGLPPEDRRPTMSAVRSNMVALTPLLNNERDQEFFDLAVTMGHSAADAESMVTYINQINSNTSLRVIFPDMPRRGPPDGFPGPRP
jgi:hypothetical protein